ncbi:N-acetylmuramoyl-L-alanine amidase [Paenibacillus thiaminolyticus]|uniref:N-acetylmuramoyl-L-alanine amidase n=1 Tax=Paenibacillus thiaminolyticus TaxID=49283 RepID=UPI003D2E37C3
MSMYNYIVDHIPRNTPNDRRPGIAMTANTLTIHTTGNPDSSARNERGWLTNPSNKRTASYHIVVDEHEVIEVIPLTENAWHAGDGNGDGNRKSIGIEICESGNYGKTIQNAAELVAHMLYERGWGVDRLRRHFDWSGKICPRLMYSGGKWTAWERFKLMVQKELEGMEKQKQQDYVGHWAEASIRRVMDVGIMNGRNTGFAPNEPITRAEIAVVADRILKQMGK